MKVKIDRFVIAIITTVLLASIFPYWGSKNNNIPWNAIIGIGVSLIFFFYGLKLSFEKITAGLKNWKLHVLIQASTFLIFPLFVLSIYPLVAAFTNHTIWLAFLFLAALPSTVSSSVVMVSIAKGNIPAAIFNASISGLIGIFITPLWMSLFLSQSSSNYSINHVYLQLGTEILLPVITGILLQPYLGKYVQQFSRQITLFDKTIILLIIFKSFANSFEANLFSIVNISDLILILTGVILLFFLVYSSTRFLATKMKFSRADSITAKFCGTKKSLVHGTVFSKILFPASFPVGIILLPLMLFHALQIFIISIIAAQYEKG